MKLIVQIPCFNEANTLALVLEKVPKSIPGIDEIRTQVIDDGSADETAEVARKLNVDYVIKNVGNKGLGNSFRIGMLNAIRTGADILVNTDGDNQYPSRYITELVGPIVRGEVDIVVGDRQTATIGHFSTVKKIFQWLGTKMTALLSGDKNITDAVSGFRAYSREAMLELNVTSAFSYVLDTTLQASCKKLATSSILIETNKPTRPSRLFNTMWQHIRKSGIDMMRVYAMYKPLRLFVGMGIVFFALGSIPIVRFLYDYFFVSGGTGMIQSLIIGGILFSVSFNCFALGVIGDLSGRNRILLEQLLKESKRQMSKQDGPS